MSLSAHDFLKQGFYLAQKEQWPEAISLLEKVLELDPNLADAYEILGVIHARLGRLDEAIELMKKLTALEPDHIMAHANLSRFYQQKGMIFEAEAEQAEARRLSWKQELKTSGAAQDAPVLEEDEAATAKNLAERIKRYKKVIELDPKDVLGYFTLGTALYEAKRYRETVDILSQGLLADPKHSPSYVTLGLSYEALGNTLEAKMTYEAGIPIAQSRGDIIPLRRMESRLTKLKE